MDRKRDFLLFDLQNRIPFIWKGWRLVKTSLTKFRSKFFLSLMTLSTPVAGLGLIVSDTFHNSFFTPKGRREIFSPPQPLGTLKISVDSHLILHSLIEGYSIGWVGAPRKLAGFSACPAT